VTSVAELRDQRHVATFAAASSGRDVIHRSPQPPSGRRDGVAGCGRSASLHPKGTAVPPTDRGLLARLDALVALTADRHGLALLSDGRLAAAEARAAGITPTNRRTPTTRSPAPAASALAQRDAVELLRAVGEGVGLLRVRGDRLEATSLRHAWAQIDPGLRAGLVYAAWCQQVTLTGLLTRPSKAATSAVLPQEPWSLVQCRGRGGSRHQ
jgi:hypothetical protein